MEHILLKCKTWSMYWTHVINMSDLINGLLIINRFAWAIKGPAYEAMSLRVNPEWPISCSESCFTCCRVVSARNIFGPNFSLFFPFSPHLFRIGRVLVVSFVSLNVNSRHWAGGICNILSAGWLQFVLDHVRGTAWEVRQSSLFQCRDTLAAVVVTVLLWVAGV